jgi:hypothetical protein
MNKRLFLLLMTVVLLNACPAGARDILLLTGAEGGAGGDTYNYYTYAGLVAPLLHDNFGNGFVQKYWVDFLGYNYPANGRDIKATAIGVEGALGYQRGGENGWGGIYGGIRYANTWLSPDNPDSSVRGSQARPLLQLEGERTLSEDWKINGSGRYLFISDSYWARGRVMYRVSKQVYTGPELIVHGDPDYRAWQWGWFVTGFEPVPKSSIGFKAGVRKTEKADLGAYFGLEFSRMF